MCLRRPHPFHRFPLDVCHPTSAKSSQRQNVRTKSLPQHSPDVFHFVMLLPPLLELPMFLHFLPSWHADLFYIHSISVVTGILTDADMLLTTRALALLATETLPSSLNDPDILWSGSSSHKVFLWFAQFQTWDLALPMFGGFLFRLGHVNFINVNVLWIDCDVLLVIQLILWWEISTVFVRGLGLCNLHPRTPVLLGEV